MSEQNYNNHVQRPSAFLAVALALLACFIGSCVNLYQSFGDHQRLYSAALILVLTICVFLTLWISRMSALKAQDRAILAQENLRHFAATGKLLDSRLTVQQVIGLRFASDAEFVELAGRAASEGLSSDAIKRSIRSWRADTHRV